MFKEKINQFCTSLPTKKDNKPTCLKPEPGTKTIPVALSRQRQQKLSGVVFAASAALIAFSDKRMQGKRYIAPSALLHVTPSSLLNASSRVCCYVTNNYQYYKIKKSGRKRREVLTSKQFYKLCIRNAQRIASIHYTYSIKNSIRESLLHNFYSNLNYHKFAITSKDIQ